MGSKAALEPDGPIVVKVGGSLLDLPDLGVRLRTWLDGLESPFVLIVPGGGTAADVIRTMDRLHALGEEAAHWLALRAMSLNAAILQALLSRSQVIDALSHAPALWRRGLVPIVDAFPFARADEAHPRHLPHCWEVTSDALAARIAVVAQARQLILLKSVPIPPTRSWEEAARAGQVDGFFGQACAPAGANLTVTAVNFRDLIY